MVQVRKLVAAAIPPMKRIYVKMLRDTGNPEIFCELIGVRVTAPIPIPSQEVDLLRRAIGRGLGLSRRVCHFRWGVHRVVVGLQIRFRGFQFSK
jgi:hypothetical protein